MSKTKSRIKWTAVTLVSAMLLTACGGGGSTVVGNPAVITPTPAVGANTVFAGPITGFGSVIVNGVRFSSVGANLQDDDGQAINLDQLKLGMTVRVSGTSDDSTQLGVANDLALVHGLLGTVTTVDVASNTLTLLGQTVHTNTATAYQGITGLSALATGQSVEVYGASQSDGSLLATLIQLKSTAFTTLRVNGVVRNFSASNFKLGSLTVNYGSALITGELGNGKRVKIKAGVSQFDAVNNVLTASTIKVEEASLVYGATVATGAGLKIKGVADAAPVNGLLNVSGTPVNVSQAVIKGSTSTITAGQSIEVKGNWDGSVLQATQVELEGYRASQIGGNNELFGAVSSINGTTVVVNGVSVDLSTAVFGHGATLAQVAVGSYVEIKGNLAGNLLQATKVELKTNSTTGNDSNDGNHGLSGEVSFEQSGLVSDFVSVANFRLNGLKVDASTARFEHNSAASLANGVYVEIKGIQGSNGVFVATKVDIKNNNNQDEND